MEDTSTSEKGSKLEAVRQQVDKEIEECWQREVKTRPKRAKEDPEVIYKGLGPEDVDPQLKADTVARFRCGKISRYLGNFHTFLSEEYREWHYKPVADVVNDELENTADGPLYFGKTFGQFLKEVDQAMEQAGISPEKYVQLKEEAKIKRTGTAFLNLENAQLDTFIQLRLMNPNAPKPTVS